jgi:hypothetical protein
VKHTEEYKTSRNLEVLQNIRDGTNEFNEREKTSGMMNDKWNISGMMNDNWNTNAMMNDNWNTNAMMNGNGTLVE